MVNSGLTIYVLFYDFLTAAYLNEMLSSVQRKKYTYIVDNGTPLIYLFYELVKHNSCAFC